MDGREKRRESKEETRERERLTAKRGGRRPARAVYGRATALLSRLVLVLRWLGLSLASPLRTGEEKREESPGV